MARGKPDRLDKVGVTNPFVGSGVAARYERARPGLHRHLADLILARHSRVARGIDVACGTGLSTTPLRRIATRVVGVDASWDMLTRASREPPVSYVQAAAEQLPFSDASFDIATVCSALHWFEPGALAELHRVVAARGTLVVYDVWFPAFMVDEPRFAEWMTQVCGPRYPSVAKNMGNLEALEKIGFRQAWEADPRYEVQMSLRSVVECIMTHSERIAAIQEGRETESEQVRFLTDGLRPLFRERHERAVEFGIRAHAFQR
jgi:ubiquinone/menaquinone biosynthesis C-methylase UbiE